jgi:cyanophycinase
MSYLTLMHNYGMSPKHVTVHIDNYKTDSNVSTPRGKANLQIIMQADVIFFNGGDQARHIRSWLNDDGTPNALLIAVRTRAISDELICSGTSAGSMIWTNQTFGGGSSFGTLYFKNLVGLAPKQVSDGGVNGTALFDNRNGTKSLQYSENAGKMPSFGFLNFTTDTHFNARGRLGRLVPVLIDLKDKFGFGVDENTSLYYENGIGTVFGWNGVTFCDI